MNRLYLIRHSLTEGNERHWYYGATELPLSEAGKRICLEARGALQLPDKITFATTGMLRTEETLKLLFGSVAHDVIPELREMNLGKFECRDYAQLKDDPDFQRWIQDDNFVIPGGESNAAFRARVADGLTRLAVEREGDLLLVCHGGTIRRAMGVFFPQDGRGFFDWPAVQPCRGFMIEFESGCAARYEPI